MGPRRSSVDDGGAGETDRLLPPDDPALRPGRRLLEFLLARGADEFAVNVVYLGDDGKAAADGMLYALSFAALGERVRERTVTREGERNPRRADAWRLDARSLEALRDVMSGDLLGSRRSGRAFAEDLCVYRAGRLVFGTVTHERLAFLRLTDEEWTAWRAADQSRFGS